LLGIMVFDCDDCFTFLLLVVDAKF
jgi:hypothetical protein